MSSTVRWAPQVRVLGHARLSITDAGTAYFDFGTPDNISLLNNANYKPGDRILVNVTTDSDGTTDTITIAVQDADDSSGSIGTPATAVTSGTLLLGAGDKQGTVAVKLQSGRPWLKVGVTESGSADTIVCHCTVLAVPSNC